MASAIPPHAAPATAFILTIIPSICSIKQGRSQKSSTAFITTFTTIHTALARGPWNYRSSRATILEILSRLSIAVLLGPDGHPHRPIVCEPDFGLLAFRRRQEDPLL